MANIYVNFGNGTTTGYYAVPVFAVSTAYSSTSNGGRGAYIRQLTTPALNSERVFRCTTAGTSAATEPTWVLTKNGTTTSGGAIFTECTGQELDNVVAGSVWPAPHARLANAFAATWSAAGDTFFLASNHAETQAAALTLTAPGTAAAPGYVYCVSQTTVPPTSANLTTSATITTTGANAMSLLGLHCYLTGVTYSAGTGATTVGISVGGQFGSIVTLINCTLAVLGTGASSIVVGASSGAAIRFNNVKCQFGATASTVSITDCDFSWKNTVSALAGSVPTSLFVNGGRYWTATLEGVDLSAMGSGKTISNAFDSPAKLYLKDCKTGSAVTIAATPTSIGAEVYNIRSDSAGTNYQSSKYAYQGTQLVETTIIRTGGASDGVTGISWNLATTANSKWISPFDAIPIVINNAVTGANVSVTVEGLWNAAALPNNDDVWFDVEYMGSATSPQGSFAAGSKADNLATGTALTASTAAWDSLVTARGNSTAYTLGQVRKVASNSGRIFFCTTAGTSAGSEPGGYASAVDGGSVTDGGAVFRAAVRFKLTVTLSSPQPGQVGYLYCYPKAAKASTTFYLCPKVLLS